MVAVGPVWAITYNCGRTTYFRLEKAREAAWKLSRRWGGASVRIRRWDANLSVPFDNGENDEYVTATGKETVEEYLQREAITRCPPGDGFAPPPVPR